MAGSIFIPLISVFDGKGISQAKTGLASIAGAVKGLKGAAVATAASMATVGAFEFVKDSVGAARDLERNMVGLGNVFGSLTPDMVQFSKDAQAIGLSQIEASRASTFLGSVLKQSGFSMEDTADQTKNLVGLASDLAATYGYDVSEALTGMTALFRGEYDPIEKFGVAMKQAEVNALLAARGQKGLTGEALRNAQAQARLDLLYSRSQDAQGSYAEQSDSLFVAQKNLAASFENMKATLGQSLLEPLAALLTAMQPIIDVGTKALTPMFKILGEVVTTLAPIFPPLMEAFFALFEAIQPILDLLIKLIKPLLIPLVDVFKLLTAIITPLIPVIQILAQVIGVILTPIILGLSLALDLVIKGLLLVFEGLSKIPGAGDAFKAISASLKSFQDETDKVTNKMLGTTDAHNEMTDALSKKLEIPDVNGVTVPVNKIAVAAKDAAKAMGDLVKSALDIQKQFIDSANINDMLDKTSNSIVESVVYLDGKFKTVITGVTSTANSIGDNFKASFAKIKTFYNNLNLLDAKKLDPELIAQIAAAGPEAGNATAEAIIASGKEGIAGLNDTFTGIKKFAGNIGAKVAVLMKNTGEDIGNGLIDGLVAQQYRLENLATQLATAFSDTFKAKVETEIQTEKKFSGPGIDPNTGKSTLGLPDMGVKMQHLKPSQIKNPYSESTDQTRYFLFQRAIQNATNFNITVDVPVGADKVAIGKALVSAIQAYEKSGGKVFTK